MSNVGFCGTTGTLTQLANSIEQLIVNITDLSIFIAFYLGGFGLVVGFGVGEGDVVSLGLAVGDGVAVEVADGAGDSVGGGVGLLGV